MKALSSSEIKIDDLGNELQFTISRETGWAEIVILTGALSGFGIFALLQQSALLACGCLVGIGALFINWANGPTTVFRISEQRVVATGNLHRWSATDFNIPASEVKSIGWFSGGEEGSDGIYVWHGWNGLKSTCVLPGLSRKKAQAVVDAIKMRFPLYEIKTGTSLSFSLGIGD
jgi:hypothetical protein